MSVSYWMEGFTTVDSPEYKKHYSVVEACNNAGVNVPEATCEFFYRVSELYSCPEEELNIGDLKNSICVAIRQHTDIEDGSEYILVNEIPKEVERIYLMCG